MALDLVKLKRRYRRYRAIVVVIAVYFGFHALTLTALPVTADNLVIASVCVTVYMGTGILLDSPAAAAAHRHGLRAIVAGSGVLVVGVAVIALLTGSLGWWLVVLAFVLACCSSLVYIPTLAHYAAMLGARQATGQRISVFVQRGGALVAAAIIAFALGADFHALLWIAILTAGVVIAGCACALPGGTTDAEAGASQADPSRPPQWMAVIIAVREVSRSHLLARGVIAAATMPLIFVLTGSVLPLALPALGAAIGTGLLLREAMAMAAAPAVGRGSLVRTNREFACTVLLAVVGIVTAVVVAQPWAVTLGVMSTGPMIASAIVTSALNTRTAAVASEHPWACFGAMGMSARLSGLLAPLVLSQALHHGTGMLATVFAVVVLALGMGMVLGKRVTTTG